MKVLSLFDGMGTGRLALQRAGNAIVVDVLYYIFKELLKRE